MTLDEAIEHCEKVAKEQENCNVGCSLEHKQLAIWLSALKAIMDMFCAKITAEHPELPPLNIKETVEKLSSDEFIENKIKSVLE